MIKSKVKINHFSTVELNESRLSRDSSPDSLWLLLDLTSDSDSDPQDSDSESGPMDSDSHLVDSDSGLMDSDLDCGLADSDSLLDSRVRTHSNTVLPYVKSTALAQKFQKCNPFFKCDTWFWREWSDLKGQMLVFRLYKVKQIELLQILWKSQQIVCLSLGIQTMNSLHYLRCLLNMLLDQNVTGHGWQSTFLACLNLRFKKNKGLFALLAWKLGGSVKSIFLLLLLLFFLISMLKKCIINHIVFCI